MSKQWDLMVRLEEERQQSSGSNTLLKVIDSAANALSIYV